MPSLGAWGKCCSGTHDSSIEQEDLLGGLKLVCVVKVAKH